MSTPQAPREPTPERVAEAALNIAERRTEESMRYQRERDEAVSTMTSYYDRIQKLEQRARVLSEALRRCADRFERCCIHSGSDKEFAARAVQEYRALIDES